MEKLITKIETINPKLSDTVVLYFNTREYPVDQVHQVFERLLEKFPNNRVIALPDKTSLKDFDKEVLLEHLNNIAKDLLVETEVYDAEVRLRTDAKKDGV